MSFHISHKIQSQDGRPVSSRYGDSIPDTLKLLSYNIQAGIGTSNYHHYITRSWRHLLPDWRGVQRLDRIAKIVAEYDLVALQEVDGGSLRSSFVNQVSYISEIGGFDYWYQQLR